MPLKHVLCDRYFHSLLFILTEILCGRLYYPHSKDGKTGLTETVQVVTPEPHDRKRRAGLEPTSTQLPQPLFVFPPHTNSQVSANFKCQVHIFQQLPFFSRAGTRRWGVPSIQAQAGNTVSHPLTIKLQKKCFAPKSSRWDPARKGETQGGCRSTVAGLSTTCLSQSPDTPQWTSDNRGDVSDHSRLPWRQVQGRRGGPARAPGGQGTQMPTCRGGTSKIITAHIFKCWDGRRKVEFHWSPWAPRQPQDVGALIRSQRWTLGGQKGRLGGWVSSLPDEQTRAPSAPQSNENPHDHPMSFLFPQTPTARVPEATERSPSNSMRPWWPPFALGSRKVHQSRDTRSRDLTQGCGLAQPFSTSLSCLLTCTMGDGFWKHSTRSRLWRPASSTFPLISGTFLSIRRFILIPVSLAF